MEAQIEHQKQERSSTTQEVTVILQIYPLLVTMTQNFMRL